MSYTQQELIARRLLAIASQHAYPLADAFAMGIDPEMSVGIVPIKIVTEEQIQAVGFGRLDQPPAIIARINPMSRDVSDLLPFAEWMGGIANHFLSGSIVRVWTPHRAALECVDILGHRYATNPDAPPIVQQMGRTCRALAAELNMLDQSLVACALELLIAHFVTGQSPAEDRHLGSFLAWLDVQPGIDVRRIARQAALLPASAILANIPGKMDDAEIEQLRRFAKNAPQIQQESAHIRMRAILESSVRREWALMLSARRHLLGLPSTAPVPDCASEQARERVAYRIGGGAFRVVQPHAVALEYKKRERAYASASRRLWQIDSRMRAAAIRRGRLLEGRLNSTNPSTGGLRPRVTVLTTQRLLRLRLGDVLHLLDSAKNFEARITAIRNAEHTDQRLVDLELEKGMQSFARLNVGQTTVWEPKDIDLIVRETRLASQIRDRAPWLLQTSTVPPSSSATLPAGDLIAVANALERIL